MAEATAPAWADALQPRHLTWRALEYSAATDRCWLYFSKYLILIFVIGTSMGTSGNTFRRQILSHFSFAFR